MTLIVDFGLKRVELPFKVPGQGSWDEAVWCGQNFKDEMCHYYNYERAWYFKRQEDAVLFALRWS